MKKITLLVSLMIVSLGFSQTILQDFQVAGAVNGGPFGDMPVPAVVAGTGTNTTQVLEIIGNTGGQVWQGINLNLASNVQLTTSKTMTIDVKSDTPITFLVKVNGGVSGAQEAAAEVTHNGNGAWQTISFSFTTALDGKAATANGVYSGFVIHAYWKTGEIGFFPNVLKPARTFYLDNIRGIAVVPIVDPVPSTGSPQPLNYATHLGLLSDITDTSLFTAFWNPSYFFGANAGTPDLDPTAVVNKAIKMRLTTGWGGGINTAGVDVTTDVSTSDMVHFDYFVPSTAAAGSLGHQFYLDLISRVGTTNTESFYGIGSTLLATGPVSEQVAKVIVFDAWQGIDIPLSAFVGFTPANFFQFKIGASSDLRTQLAYFDNIYFYKASTLLSSSKFETSKFRMYPNPASSELNIESDNAMNEISVFNMLGQEVLRKSTANSNEVLNINSIQSGVYLLKVSSDNGFSTKRFVKK